VYEDNTSALLDQLFESIGVTIEMSDDD